MGYHFLLGAVVGATSVLVLGSRRTRDLLNKGQHLVKDNLDEGMKAIKATGDCIRVKMQSDEEAPAAHEKTEAVKSAAAKRPQRARKEAAKKTPTDE